MQSLRRITHHGQHAWPGVIVWLAAWLALHLLDGHVDLASLALLLVLASALAAQWLPPWVAMAACALAVLAFNWSFVPPRGSFTVDLHQHALLLATMLAVGGVVAWTTARQRGVAARERLQARQAAELRGLGDALRDADDPADCAPALREALARSSGGQAVVMLLRGPLPADNDAAACRQFGDASADAQAGLWLCLRQGVALGPGSGHHEDQADIYLPLRGRSAALGAAWLPLATPVLPAHSHAHAQALCDQFGMALERHLALQVASAARDAAASQQLRNTLLTAISHDYRTPLATIMGAASALQEQGERLGVGQRARLAATIVDEAEQLGRLTDNTLQLARLDAPGLALQLDWESAEEIVGSVLRRARQRDPGRRLRSRVEAGLPWLRCDAVLLVQLLDNLVDNALKYSAADAPVEVTARRIGAQVVLAVRDRGPGIAPAWREHVFEVFRRGEPGPAPPMQAPRSGEVDPSAPSRRGAGVGLAVCRAIARAHGGTLTLRPRGHGGSSFECALPVLPAPAGPVDAGTPSPTAASMR